jgi:selenide,water dikinase
MVEGRHLLLVGGGHAHVEVVRRLAAAPLPGWRVTLLTREAMSPYSGMLPGVVAGLYRPAQALIDTRALAARAGATLVLDTATGLDPAARLLRRAAGPPIGFDLLSIDTGATPDTNRADGAATHAIALKPIDALLPRLQALLARGAAEPGLRIAVVGAGAAGVEMAFALAARLPAAVVTLVAGTSGLLPGFTCALRRRVARELVARRVALLAGADVAAVTEDGLRFASTPPLACDAVLWAAGAAAAPWLAETGLARDARGFLRIDATLRAIGHPHIFAAGDVASLGESGLPKAGVFAVRQGPVLAANLRAAAQGEALGTFRPQRHFLVLLALGDGRAIGTRGGLVFGGRWVWWWKDRIDRGFMRRYQEGTP